MGEGGEELKETMLAQGGSCFDRGMSSLEVETRALAEVLERVSGLLT